MLKIRLQRTGRRNNPSFRIVLTDRRNGPQSGKFLEVLGSYNPRVKNPEIKGERILHLMSNGAQLSDTMHNLLINAGVIKGKKINVLPKKSPIIKEEEESKTSADVAENKIADGVDADENKKENTDTKDDNEKTNTNTDNKEESQEKETKDSEHLIGEKQEKTNGNDIKQEPTSDTKEDKVE